MALTIFIVLLVNRYRSQDIISDNIRFLLPIPPLGVASYVFVFNMFRKILIKNSEIKISYSEICIEVILATVIVIIIFLIFTLLLAFLVNFFKDSSLIALIFR